MLSLQLRLSDLSQPWTWRDEQWVSGKSWIRPFDHLVLDFSCRRSETRTVIEVRERRADGDFVTIKIRRDRVSLTAGPHGTAPLYLTMRNGVLCGSWHLPDLVVDNSDHLLDRAVTRMLTRRHRYSSDTLFADVHRLTERATATANPSAGLAIRYPPDALHVTTPRRLRQGVDPVRAFDILLVTLTARVSARPTAPQSSSPGAPTPQTSPWPSRPPAVIGFAATGCCWLVGWAATSGIVARPSCGISTSSTHRPTPPGIHPSRRLAPEPAGTRTTPTATSTTRPSTRPAPHSPRLACASSTRASAVTIERRVIFFHELEQYLHLAGFDVLDIVDYPTTATDSVTGPAPFVAARYTG